MESLVKEPSIARGIMLRLSWILWGITLRLLTRTHRSVTMTEESCQQRTSIAEVKV